jgi:hypothetical protein
MPAGRLVLHGRRPLGRSVVDYQRLAIVGESIEKHTSHTLGHGQTMRGPRIGMRPAVRERATTVDVCLTGFFDALRATLPSGRVVANPQGPPEKKRAIPQRDGPCNREGVALTPSPSSEAPALSEVEGWRSLPGQLDHCPGA